MMIPMVNVVVASLVLLQMVGLFALVTALHRARDGREDATGFHEVANEVRPPE
jgi:hypothetical protein